MLGPTAFVSCNVIHSDGCCMLPPPPKKRDNPNSYLIELFFPILFGNEIFESINMGSCVQYNLCIPSIFSGLGMLSS